MPRFRFLLLLCTTIFLACLSRADAQNARGITIGAPKAFEKRTLNLMLERLNAQLANINVVDQKSLSQAIGTAQGSSRIFSAQLPCILKPGPYFAIRQPRIAAHAQALVRSPNCA
jgi:hypothetical protein